MKHGIGLTSGLFGKFVCQDVEEELRIYKKEQVEGNGHCCHRPSSNWETNQAVHKSLVTTVMVYGYLNNSLSNFFVEPLSSTRGVHPPKSMMHVAYSPNFLKFINHHHHQIFV